MESTKEYKNKKIVNWNHFQKARKKQSRTLKLNLTSITETTAALIAIGQRHTVDGAGWVARSRTTLIHISLTMHSSETRRAGASVPPHTVHTLATVLTAWAKLWGAFIHIHLTLQTCRTERRCSGEICISVSHLHTKRTAIGISLSVYTFGARRARTGEAVDQIDAGASIPTGIRLALVNIIFTVHTLITCFALKEKERGLYIKR